MNEDWRRDAACADAGDLFFPSGEMTNRQTRAAKAVCGTCRVRSECLEWVTEHFPQAGIWAGLTEEERRLAHNRTVRETKRVTDVAERRRKVADLRTRGVQIPVIARELDCSPTLIHKDLQRLGLTGEPVKLDPDVVVKLADEGVPSSKIAAMFGVTHRAVNRVLNRHRGAAA